MNAFNFVLITMIMLLICNVIGFVISILPIFFKRFLKYRIQDKKINLKTFYKRLPLISLNVFLLFVLSTIGLYFLYPVLFTDSLEFDLVIIIFQVFFVLIFDDLFFYFLHKWMHDNKYILKTIHSIHHKATAPLALDYMYVHPLEWLMGYIGPFIGIILLSILSPLSCWSFWIYQLVRTLHEMDVHSGFKSFFSKSIPLWGESEHHDKHHEILNGNYASTFTIWDRIFKTKIN